MEALLLQVATILAWLVVVLVLNTLFVALAFKVYWGYEPLPVEFKEFAWRSALVGLGITGSNLVGSAVYFVLWTFLGLSQIYAAIASLLVQFPLCVTAVFLFFALEEWVESTGIAVLQTIFATLFWLGVIWLFPAVLPVSVS
jgi:hypothetical protein